ncbi:MAG: hypothetical protein QM764_08850 [Chitinophagaceae bacterium]
MLNKHFCTAVLALFFCQLVAANPFNTVSITGPTCGTANTVYQFTIVSSPMWTNSTNMQWCVTGGTISTTSGGTFTTGCKSATPLPNVYVKFTSSGSITLTTSLGNATLNFTVSSSVTGGNHNKYIADDNVRNRTWIKSWIKRRC